MSQKNVNTSGAAARLFASKTHKSARPTPGVVNCGSLGLFCPRCAVVTNTLSKLGPAIRTSRGSSPTRSVDLTYGRDGTLVSTHETLCPGNPLGMKGCGEAGAIGSPPAVINAITDAIGSNELSMPATPEKVWQLCQSQAKQAAE